MAFIAIIIWVFTGDYAFLMVYYRAVPFCPTNFNDRVGFKTVVAFLPPSVVHSVHKVIFKALLRYKLNLLIHRVVKQFVNSPAYLRKTLIKICHSTIVVV